MTCSCDRTKKGFDKFIRLFCWADFLKTPILSNPNQAWLGFQKFRLSQHSNLSSHFLDCQKIVWSGTYSRKNVWSVAHIYYFKWRWRLHNKKHQTTIAMSKVPTSSCKFIIKRAKHPAPLFSYSIKYKQMQTLVRICHTFLQT